MPRNKRKTFQIVLISGERKDRTARALEKVRLACARSICRFASALAIVPLRSGMRARDHNNEPATLSIWLGNKTADNMRQWIAAHTVLVAVEGEWMTGVAAVRAMVMYC
jgi:hypothetical protein